MLWICVSVFFKRSPQLQPLSDIPVRTTKDIADPWFDSMAVLTSGRLVVVDHDNYAVKLVDIVQYKGLCILEMEDRPTDVCSLPDNRAAVALPDMQRILILECDNKLLVVTEIRVQGECTEVAYSNGHLIVLYTDPVKVEILHINGEVVKQNMLEISEILYFDSLSVNSEGNVTSIFVRDDENRRILRLDEDLQEQQVYRLPRDNAPWGFPEGAALWSVVAVGENQLLMTDYIARLWQLDTTTGRWTLLNEDLCCEAEYSMAFCHDRNVLYFGYFCAIKRYAIS